MPDKDVSTPRVFIARHGETEYTQTGQYTGITELPLTPHGKLQVSQTARILFGAGKLISPAKVSHVFISPRWRALQTAELLFGDLGIQVNDGKGVMSFGAPEAWKGVVFEQTETIQEWNYGAYEHMKTSGIRAARKGRGLDGEREWDIWRDGCEGGESPMEVTQRVDELIARIRGIQGDMMNGEGVADVVLVAHGHILRAFTKRWLGYPLDFPLSMMMEPGGVGVLSYQHHSVEEPAFLVGVGYPT